MSGSFFVTREKMVDMHPECTPSVDFKLEVGTHALKVVRGSDMEKLPSTAAMAER